MNMFNSSTKPTASLSSGLLARKGQARPAMRPQGYVGYTPQPVEDLGWNDMGHDVPPLEPTPAPVDHMPAPAPVVPPVLRQREALSDEFTPKSEAAAPDPVEAEPKAEIIVQPEAVVAPSAEAEVEAEPPVHKVSLATAQRFQRETAPAKGRRGRKAAFTLRLDADRHLRLRLASAIRGDSAQVLVTDALDALLNSIPEVEALASQLPERGGAKSRGMK